MFKIYEIIALSRIKFLNFSSTERVKQNKKCKAITFQAISTKVEHFFFDKIKNARQSSLFKQFQQKRNNFFFLAFHWKCNPFTLWNIRCTGPNTDLPWNSIISKTESVKSNIFNNVQVDKLFTWFSSYWSLKFKELFEPQNRVFWNFPVLKGWVQSTFQYRSSTVTNVAKLVSVGVALAVLLKTRLAMHALLKVFKTTIL